MIKSGIYEHYKGSKYELIAIANHSETLEKVVVYKALYGEGELEWYNISRVDKHPKI